MASSDRVFAGTPRFDLKRRIGAGGMGVVYEAFDRELDAPVAIKTLKSVDAQSIYRIKREFRALQGLEHPNLVRLGELIEHDGHWFFTMELVRGVNLLRYVRETAVVEAGQSDISPSEDTMQSVRTQAKQFAPVDEGRLRDTLGQLALGLCALHDAGKIHRDVKPSNTLVGADGRVQLLDFGLITETSRDHQSTELSAVGTAEYMSPEQAATKAVGPETDWYSAGVMLYEALTARLPFTGTPLQVLMDKQHRSVPRPRSLVPSAPSDLDELCMELLRVDPTSRPTGKEVLRRLGVVSTVRSLTRSTSRGSLTPPFVGRERELGILEQAFERRGDGEPGVVHLWGESGVGKSELVRRFCARVAQREPEAAVLWGRCYERESVPYRALDGIADSLCSYLRRLPEQEAAAILPRRAALLAKLFPVLLRVDAIANAPILGDAAMDPQELRARMFAAFRGLFEMMAERYPVVLVIDDFQWADADSLTLLSELLHPPDAPPLLLLTTARDPDAGGRLTEAMDAIGEPIPTEHLEVGRLAQAEALALVKSLEPKLGDDVDRAAAFAAIVRESEGHPLFILELVRHGEAEGGGGGALKLDEALWERIAHLPDEARALLEILSVAGTPVAVGVAGAAARLDRAATDRALSLLRVAYLARTTTGGESAEPYHDRVRTAVLSHLPDAARREFHDRIATALEAVGAADKAPQVLVRHFEAAGKTQVAARHAAEAAHRARRALAFQQAANLYRDALRLGELDDEARRALGINLADSLSNAGRCIEAAEVYLDVAAHAEDNATRFDCRRRAVDQLLVGGEIGRGIDAVRALLDDIGVPLPATPARSLVSLLWNRLCLRLRGVAWKHTHERDVPGATLTKLDVLQSVGRGLAMVDNIRGADFQSRTLRLALRTGETTRVAVALGLESVYLGSQGGGGGRKARERIARLQEVAAESDVALVQAWAIVSEGIVNYFGSRFDLAAEQIERAADMFRDRTTGTTYELNNSRLFRLFALRHAGRIADAGALHDPSVSDAVRRGDRYMQTTMRRYGSFLWLARGRPDDAERGLAETSWVPPQDRFHIQHWFELEARCEVALYRGAAAAALEQHADAFAAMGKSLLRRIQIIRTIERSLYGRLLLSANAETRDREPARRVRKLARKLLAEDVGIAQVYGHLLAAGAAHQLGDADGAVAALRRAVETSDAPPMRFGRTCAQLRLADLVGGAEADELRASVELYAAAEGIADVSRFAEILAPGYAG